MKTQRSPFKRGIYLATAAGGVALGAAALTAIATANAHMRRIQPFLGQVAPDLISPALFIPIDRLPSEKVLKLLHKASGAKADIKPASGDRASINSTKITNITGVNPDDDHPFSARKFEPSTSYSAQQSQAQHRPAMLWAHGGGHVGGKVEVYDHANAAIAEELDMVVIAPSYRKAPTYPFPADLDDCYAALRWMQDNAEELGIDPTRIAVCGDSAGGGIAAGIVQRAIDDGHPVAFQGLVYPMLDHRTEVKQAALDDARGSNARGKFIWTRGLNTAAWKMYLGDDHLEKELPAYASPFYREDFTGFPPTWIGVGGLDLFFDESQEFAERLEAAGVDVEFTEYESAYHGFEHMAAEAVTTKKRYADLIEAMRSAFFSK